MGVTLGRGARKAGGRGIGGRVHGCGVAGAPGWASPASCRDGHDRPSLVLCDVSRFLICNACIAYTAGIQRSDLPATTLTIRNVDGAVKEQLRVRAARHRRSMEAELRSILSDALAGERDREPNLAEAIRRRFAALGDVELEPHPPVTIGPPPVFDP